MTMSKLRTITTWVGVLIVIGLAVFFRGYQAQDRGRTLTPSEVSRAAATMNAINQGNPPPLVAGVDTLPEGPNGKLAWFLRKYSERYAAAQRQIALKQGADIDMLPREWPQARYIADAAAYPAVEAYFLAYLRYLEMVKERYPALMDSIARITVVESRMETADSADVLKGITAGVASKRQANLQMINDGQAYGQAALRLHYYLASLGPRVSYDSAANTAKFEVDAERQKANMLLADVQSSSAKLAAAAKR
jgi:hypothetical protein